VQAPLNEMRFPGATRALDRQFGKVTHDPAKVIRVGIPAHVRHDIRVVVQSLARSDGSISSLCLICSSNLHHDIESTSPVSYRSWYERRAVVLSEGVLSEDGHPSSMGRLWRLQYDYVYGV
jgi:hypothetical protein